MDSDTGKEMATFAGTPAPVGVVRAAAIVQFLFCGALCVTCGYEATTGMGQGDWLKAFFAAAVLSTLFALFDVFKTCKATAGLRSLIPWAVQHSICKRSGASASVFSLTLFPSLLLFVGNGSGGSIIDRLQTMNQEWTGIYQVHLTTCSLVLVSGVSLLPYFDHALKRGHWGTRDASCCYVFGKFMCLPFLLATASAVIGLVSNMSRMELNSGMVVLSMALILSSLWTFFQYSKFVCTHSAKHTKALMVLLRASTAMHMGVLYLMFWVGLILIIVLGSGGRMGFWATVGLLPAIDIQCVYVHIFLWVGLLLVSAVRVYMAKLRKKNRAPRILEGIPSNQVLLTKYAKRKQAQSSAGAAGAAGVATVKVANLAGLAAGATMVQSVLPIHTTNDEQKGDYALVH